MTNLPDGMLQSTFDYLIAFTIAHEGDTPFMYNNFPLKNTRLDVTVGVGHALPSEDAAATDGISSMFTVKATGQPATGNDTRNEYRRVASIDRTKDNLFSAYQDASPLLMDRDAMLADVGNLMLGFWDARGQDFADFDQVPAQAQVALMSYNYGLRLRNAPKMCDAVRDGDFAIAAEEAHVRGWDERKNEAHRRLFENAKTIIDQGLDLNLLPPIDGPFKPPPTVET